jgi:pyruvate kinase
MKLTKVVATIGPASDSPERLEELIRAGVNVFRFNFKHGEVDWHRERIQRVRRAAEKLGALIGTMMDLQGPSFRIILSVSERQISPGDIFEFGSEEFTITHPHIIPLLKQGQRLLVDDGTISFTVVEPVRNGGTTAKIRSESAALLKNRKSLNVPGADFPVELLTERDLVGIDIAVSERMELVAFSFSRTAQDIRDVRMKLAEKGCKARIVAKLETAQSMDNLEEIVQETDAVMVARGDLGVETPMEQVPIHQKKMIQMCLRYGKTVIIATQMMASMECNRYPTRAEVSDVANAILDHTDAIMLSGESAVGKYPVEAVEMMSRIAQHTELHGSDFRTVMTKMIITDNPGRIAHIAYKLYEDSVISGKRISAFLVFTHTGRTARLVSHFHARIPIHAITPNQMVAGALALNFGVFPHIASDVHTGEIEKDQVQSTITQLKKKGVLKSGDSIIVMHGDYWGALGGTSTVRIVEVR